MNGIVFFDWVSGEIQHGGKHFMVQNRLHFYAIFITREKNIKYLIAAIFRNPNFDLLRQPA